MTASTNLGSGDNANGEAGDDDGTGAGEKTVSGADNGHDL